MRRDFHNYSHARVSRPVCILASCLTVWALLFFAFAAKAQDPMSCSDLHKGIFHYYRGHSSGHLYCFRDSSLEYVHDDANADTTIWQIDWLDECSYTEKYLSGSHTISDKQLAFLQKHLLAYKVIKVTEDYYIAKEHLNKVSGLYIETDTMWFYEKMNTIDNELFAIYPNADLLATRFADTSRCAILYLYRPKKLTNSLGSYPVYLDDKLLCIARNNSGYLFKVFREGKFTVSSRLFKDRADVDVDIRFGKTYYVKSMVHWAVSSRLYNFKLENAVLDTNVGQTEFEAVKLR